MRPASRSRSGRRPHCDVLHPRDFHTVHGADNACDVMLDAWYHWRYLPRMAMTLRLDEQETDALRRRAELEGRSMQDVARQAVRDYIERTSKRELLDRVLDDELPRYAEALERLGQ